MRPVAPKADLRPFQISAASVADWLSLIVLTPCLRAISMMRSQHGVHLGVGAFDLDDQQRLDIHGITGLGEGLADLDGGLVHEFDGDRDDARADDVGDAGAGGNRAFKAEQHRPGAFRLGEQPDRCFRDDAELAFRPADQPSRS
jgi:hypothetical protein